MFLDELLELVDVVVNWCHNCASCQSLDCKHQKTSTDINRYQTSQKHWSLSKSERASDRSASISPHFGGGFIGSLQIQLSRTRTKLPKQHHKTTTSASYWVLPVSYQTIKTYLKDAENLTAKCLHASAYISYIHFKPVSVDSALNQQLHWVYPWDDRSNIQQLYPERTDANQRVSPKRPWCSGWDSMM